MELEESKLEESKLEEMKAVDTVDTVEEPGASSQELEQLLAEARERLEGLVRDLRAVDAELEGLATERKQHDLLHDALRALEELNQIGGTALFWNGAVGSNPQHLHSVRSRVEEFQKRIGEIE